MHAQEHAHNVIIGNPPGIPHWGSHFAVEIIMFNMCMSVSACRNGRDRFASPAIST